MVMRGEGLNGDIADTDPQQVGVRAAARPRAQPGCRAHGGLVNQWLAEARAPARPRTGQHGEAARLRDGPQPPKFLDVYKLKAACVAVYPMWA